MAELKRLRAEHAAAVLDFERTNRAWFARSVSDRGDACFDEFADRLTALLADQDAGVGVFHVLVDDDGCVLGRFNAEFDGDGSVELGYRVAQRVAGRGLATATVTQLCDLLAAEYGIETVLASVTDANSASHRVLVKAGFRATGPAVVGGRSGIRHARAVTPMPDEPMPDEPMPDEPMPDEQEISR